MSAEAARQAENVVALRAEQDAPPIAEGNYRAVYVRTTTINMRMFGGAPKVIVDFRIVDPGEAFGRIVSRFYRAKPGRNGALLFAKRSELFLTLARLTSAKLRRDRLSVKEVLRGRVLLISVRTVRTDYKGRALPPTLLYSVVDNILAADTETGQQTPPVCSVQCPARNTPIPL